MGKKSEEGLVGHLDTFFLKLMEEAYPPVDESDEGGPKVGFVDRVRLFDSGVRWVQTKHKVDPEEEEDAFAAARKRTITSGTRGGRASRAASPGANGHG